jgi:tetratricopeptide (TPR) repeat protein
MPLRFLILLAFLCAINHCPAQPSKTDPYSEALAGQKLSAGQVSDLETAVTKNPDDLAARTKLLGYYFMRQDSSKEAGEARQKHIFWIIKNHPEAAIAGLPFCEIDPVNPFWEGNGYKRAKQLWLEQTKAHAQNTAILGNAAQFFLIFDKDLAEDLLKQAQKAEPDNPKWSERLGHLYALKNGNGNSTAVKSLKEFEKAQSADASELTRFYRLDDLAKQAFEAGEIEKASQYANELLETAQKYPKDWNYGNAIHHGNNVLGLVALKQGDVKKAVQYLLDAGKTPGSPQLNSFGPNMTLAKELLEKGENDAVLQYFELCRKFWSSGAEKLDHWAQEVKVGKTPDFGANLVY